MLKWQNKPNFEEHIHSVSQSTSFLCPKIGQSSRSKRFYFVAQEFIWEPRLHIYSGMIPTNLLRLQYKKYALPWMQWCK